MCKKKKSKRLSARVLSFVVSAVVFSSVLVLPSFAKSSMSWDIDDCSYYIEYITGNTVPYTLSIDSGKYPAITDASVFTEQVTTWGTGNCYMDLTSKKNSFESDKSYICPEFRVDFKASQSDSSYYPNTINCKVGGRVFTSEKYTHYSSGSDHRFRYYFKNIEVSEYSGVFAMSFDMKCTFPSSKTYKFTPIFRRYFTFDVLSESDRVLSGLNSTFGDNYSKPDGTIQDEYNKMESDAMAQVKPGIDTIVSNWGGLGGTLFEYQGAFLGFNQFFNSLTGIPWIGTLILISVAVGIFALLLGAIGFIASSKTSNSGKSGGSGRYGKRGG